MNSPFDAETTNAIARDAGAFAYQIDLIQRRALFLRLGQDDLRAASFLDERLGTQGRDGFWLPLDSLKQVAAAIPSPVAPAYIFHIGHCGSTLLSRMLEQFGNALALREPMALRGLATAGGELESPLSRLSIAEWDELLLAFARLFGRPFSADQRIIIKATSSCNNLIEPLLIAPGDARAVLLHIPLESYLATMLKGQGGGLDALISAPARLQYLHSRLDDNAIRLHQLQHAEILAMGWLAELSRFHEIEKRFEGSGQIVSSNFEDILAQPEQHTAAIAEHLGVTPKHGEQRALENSTVMRTYAKSPDHAYSKADRDHDLNLSRRTFAPQLAQGLQWAERLIQRHPQLRVLESQLR